MTKSLVIRVRKFVSNKLLERKQFILDVFSADHQNPTRAEIKAEIAKKFKANEDTIVVYGLESRFGGGRTSGFGFVYNNKDSLMKFEPKFRKLRSGLIVKKAGVISRRLKKETKNKLKKFRGKTKLTQASASKKKK